MATAEITGDFNLGLKDSAMTAGTGPNRRALLTDILGDLENSIDLSLTGEVTGLLPVYFPTESLFRGNLEIGGALSLEPLPMAVLKSTGPSPARTWSPTASCACPTKSSTSTSASSARSTTCC